MGVIQESFRFLVHRMCKPDRDCGKDCCVVYSGSRWGCGGTDRCQVGNSPHRGFKGVPPHRGLHTARSIQVSPGLCRYGDSPLIHPSFSLHSLCLLEMLPSLNFPTYLSRSYRGENMGNTYYVSYGYGTMIDWSGRSQLLLHEATSYTTASVYVLRRPLFSVS